MTVNCLWKLNLAPSEEEVKQALCELADVDQNPKTFEQFWAWFVTRFNAHKCDVATATV